MFEKEAEEYAEKDFGMYAPTDQERYAKETDWRNGAEFGYNKANEWHYPSKGEYPKDNKPVLCILGDVDTDSYEVGYYNDVGNGEPWNFETYQLPDDDGDNAWGVSAWKEIVPPKESE